MIQAVFFDLDGTLLPMDQDRFVKAYFGGLAKKCAPLGYEPKALVEGVWAGTAAMVANDGGRTNEEVFWETFAERFGKRAYADIPVFNEFYEREFSALSSQCGFTPAARTTLDLLHRRGVPCVLATNPVFPMLAQRTRVGWAGLSPDDFIAITSYENSRFCKPNPAYFSDLLERFGFSAEECIMVGNDVDEDMVASSAVGMRNFLLTGCMINRRGLDVTPYPRGGFEELCAFLEEG